MDRDPVLRGFLRSWRWSAVMLAIATGVIAFVAVQHSRATAGWSDEAPSQRRGAQVAGGDWTVRLPEGTRRPGTLALRRAEPEAAAWARSLGTLAARPDGRVGEPVEVSLRGAKVPRDGAVLRRSLPAPLPRGAQSAIAYYDDRHDAWQVVPTRVSADRRTLTARVGHFSLWDDVQYLAGWLLDTRVSAPECERERPPWLDDVTFVDDKNAPLRWCAGRDPRERSRLVVTVAVNRSYGMAVRPAVDPVDSEDSLFGSGPEQLAGHLWVKASELPPNLRGTFGGQFPVMGGEQVSFTFTEEQVHGVGSQPLVRVSPEVNNAIAGFTLSALLNVGGMKSKRLAAIEALVATAQCESDIGRPLLARRFSDAAQGATHCLTKHADDVARDTATVLATTLPGRNPRELGRLAGRIGGKLWQVWAVGAAFQVATWFADRHLPAAAFELHAFPRVAATGRPRPRATPASSPTPGSTPTAAPPASGFEPGAAFRSRCVVAWPTAPVHTSRGIEMTMSCSSVPLRRFLFTKVSYDNPDFKITPSTGTVLISGRVVDVARSEYGYSQLIVAADDISR